MDAHLTESPKGSKEEKTIIKREQRAITKVSSQTPKVSMGYSKRAKKHTSSKALNRPSFNSSAHSMTYSKPEKKGLYVNRFQNSNSIEKLKQMGSRSKLEKILSKRYSVHERNKNSRLRSVKQAADDADAFEKAVLPSTPKMMILTKPKAKKKVSKPAPQQNKLTLEQLKKINDRWKVEKSIDVTRDDKEARTEVTCKCQQNADMSNSITDKYTLDNRNLQSENKKLKNYIKNLEDEVEILKRKLEVKLLIYCRCSGREKLAITALMTSHASYTRKGREVKVRKLVLKAMELLRYISL